MTKNQFIKELAELRVRVGIMKRKIDDDLVSLALLDEMDENQKEKYEWLTDADFEFDIFINSLNELLKK